MSLSQKHKHICNSDEYIFKKMKIGIRTYKQAKKRKPSKNKRCSKPKTKVQVEKSFTIEEKYYLVIE
tara:strand:+ start:141 stop:341 length:201 start_codon:yes stop_codon:yes gene_type:complete